jgi:hypothetical protein
MMYLAFVLVFLLAMAVFVLASAIALARGRAQGEEAAIRRIAFVAFSICVFGAGAYYVPDNFGLIDRLSLALVASLCLGALVIAPLKRRP